METPRQHFFGRERLLQEIVTGVLSDQPGSFSLVGTKYVGKSYLLSHLASPEGPLLGEEYESQRPLIFRDPATIVVLKIDCDWHEAQQGLMDYLNQRLRHHVETAERIALNWKRVEEQPGSARQIWQIARQLNQLGLRLVLLMDNFDRVFESQLIGLESVDELRPLTLELALVVATEQPLHDLDRDLAASPLFNVMTQLFVGLLEAEAAEQWLDAHCAQFPALATMKEMLLTLTGTHPYLLRRIGDILVEIGQFLAPGHALGSAHAEIIRLRLAEHGRLLFVTLWRKLQKPPQRIQAGVLNALLEGLIRGPLSAVEVAPQHFTTLNWLINQAIVSFGDDGYRFFSPLFAEFMAARPAADGTMPGAVKVASGQNASAIYQQLTKTERLLLQYFQNHSGVILSPEQLLRDVWQRPEASTRRVQEAIRRLRLQLEKADPPVGVIENERGLGYRFVPADNVHS